ncbi:MAG: hypothetical protein LRZ98_01430 [Candidatus Pacebacteria bacterium]|nr:hypothetical protein [Candidatus Paceibacterota bacterium]
MSILKELNLIKNNLSHFYVILGNPEQNKKDILGFLKNKINFIYKQNPDFFNFKGEMLLIDQVRKIKKINNISIIDQDSYRIFFLDFQKISKESQNALLKILEEPSEKTIFFLFVNDKSFLFKTILSRAQILSGSFYMEENIGEDFIKSSFLERKNKILNLKKEEMQSFFCSLEKALLKQNINDENERLKILKHFSELKKQSKFTGSNLNYILEFLSFYIPKN